METVATNKKRFVRLAAAEGAGFNMTQATAPTTTRPSAMSTLVRPCDMSRSFFARPRRQATRG